jgi:hypothetical protein
MKYYFKTFLLITLSGFCFLKSYSKNPVQNGDKSNTELLKEIINASKDNFSSITGKYLAFDGSVIGDHVYYYYETQFALSLYENSMFNDAFMNSAVRDRGFNTEKFYEATCSSYDDDLLLRNYNSFVSDIKSLLPRNCKSTVITSPDNSRKGEDFKCPGYPEIMITITENKDAEHVLYLTIGASGYQGNLTGEWRKALKYIADECVNNFSNIIGQENPKIKGMYSCTYKVPMCTESFIYQYNSKNSVEFRFYEGDNENISDVNLQEIAAEIARALPQGYTRRDNLFEKPNEGDHKFARYTLSATKGGVNLTVEMPLF